MSQVQYIAFIIKIADEYRDLANILEYVVPVYANECREYSNDNYVGAAWLSGMTRYEFECWYNVTVIGASFELARIVAAL